MPVQVDLHWAAATVLLWIRLAMVLTLSPLAQLAKAPAAFWVLFTLVLAGGGLRHRGAYGVTDDLSAKIVDNRVSVPDFHATIHAAMGVDPSRNLGAGSRPVPITDGGRPIAALFG